MCENHRLMINNNNNNNVTYDTVFKFPRSCGEAPIRREKKTVIPACIAPPKVAIEVTKKGKRK